MKPTGNDKYIHHIGISISNSIIWPKLKYRNVASTPALKNTKEAINAVRFISSLRIFACLEEVNEARKSTCI